jgi:peptide/nickel transport system ATP-binding protein
MSRSRGEFAAFFMNSEQSGALRLKVLEARGLSKVFKARGPFSAGKSTVTAFQDVDLCIFSGRTLALVGESGAGKSTLAQCLVRLDEPSSGELIIDGCDFLALTGTKLRRARRLVQLIFQEAMSALNPSFSAGEIIAEPLVVAEGLSWKDAVEKAATLMETVGLRAAWADRRANEFSGGQKQRLALARALALNPKILILDEALSGLDLAVQAQMIKLLAELQASHNLGYLFISHDLSLVHAIADEVAVMKNGLIVEHASSEKIFSDPRHPYTQSLVSAMRALECRWDEEMAVLP